MHCSNKSVILTGGRGLIGKEAIEPLIENGFEVFALSSQKISTKTSIKNLHWLECDIFDNNSLKNIFDEVKASHLLHFAWCSVGDYLTNEINNTYKEASLAMLKYFVENKGKKAVFAGTCFEYEFKNEKIKEKDKLMPISLYAKCKANLYKDATLYCEKNELNFAWGRIFYVYGKNEHEKRLTPYIIKKLLADEEVIISYGSLQKDYMYSKDVANAFVKLLDSEIEGAINICTGKAISLADYATTIAKILGKEGLLNIKYEESDQASYIVGDTARLLHELSYEMQYDLEKGIKNLLDEEFLTHN